MKYDNEIALEICARHAKLAGERSNFESHWDEIAERIWPDRNTFTATTITPGEKRTEKVFDATAALALVKSAAAVESMVFPRTQRWHGMESAQFKGNKNVGLYTDALTDTLFTHRYSTQANFASQAFEAAMSMMAFGTGCLLTDDYNGSPRYKSIHLAEIFIAENHAGVIDTVHRKFNFTARQAAQQFGVKNLPDKIVKCLEKEPDQVFEFIHCIRPNKDYERGSNANIKKAFSSYYVAIDCKEIVEQGGYHAMPYSFCRYITTPDEVYGRSPAMLVLPDIKMLNEMSKTVLRAAQMAVEPPLLLQEDGALSAFNLRPGALNYGGVDDQGRQVVHPLMTGARVDIGLEMMDQRRQVINDAFLVTLFQILVENHNMTATEAMLRAQEKGQLLAPTMGRVQSELLGPMVERELDILVESNQLPDMPEELIQAGGIVDIKYTSPLNRLQRSEDGVAILRTLEAITPLAQFDPSVLEAFDGNEIARELAEINGMPHKCLRSPEEIAQRKQAAAEQEQLAQLTQAAPLLGQGAKAFAEANQIAQAPLPTTSAA